MGRGAKCSPPLLSTEGNWEGSRMTSPVTIELYSDIHCPWAYTALYRLRKVWPEYKDRVRIQFRSLSLELKNKRPTPKPLVDQEALLMVRQQPDLPIQIWARGEWEFVPTLLPA